MAVLLQYNVSTTWTATQLSDATGIKMDLLLQVNLWEGAQEFSIHEILFIYLFYYVGGTNPFKIQALVVRR